MGKEFIREKFSNNKQLLDSEDENYVHNLYKRAIKLHKKGDLDQAILSYKKIILSAPKFAKVYNNLGVALRAKNLFPAAISAYEKSLSLAPNDAGTLSNMGNALRAIGKFKDAEKAHRKAIKVNPLYTEATYNLGLVLKDMGHFEKAIECFNLVLSQKPDHIEAHWDRSLTYLQSGDLLRGFEEYEWRWKLKRNPPRDFISPLWRGENLNNKTLLIHCEQGIGDSIQFARYIVILRQFGGKLILECQSPLKRLLNNLNECEVYSRGEELPDFDYHIPLLSIPKILATTIGKIPNKVPYIFPYIEDVMLYKKLIQGPDNWLKVGICWAGKPSQGNDRNRSSGLEPFLSILGIKNTIFYSLQVGPRANEIKEYGATGLIYDLSADLHDFAHTAAVIDNLDLVISVDTSVAHLAGAMNKKLWITLCYTGDWRYLHKKTTTDWYPSAELIQQEKFGDWESVFKRIKNKLENYKKD
ncbi:MAG: hypothetical protein CL567_05480 [Alphaproteobacteria bacterium]|nr:hypothetical protein [Alphaproteobacteria bacterium]|tara:strand:+ start:4449 stop:5861 length:1413 start_codon:yes stop_codon:yes gene_type:complete